jgi:RNA recognition motif-containing protein
MKGFAHIDFNSKEVVEKAIQKNGESLCGRELRIDNPTSKGGYDQKKGGFQQKG